MSLAPLSSIASIATALARVVWPDACAACGVLCGPEGLCGPCATEIAYRGAGSRCRRCGATLGPYSPPREGCEACRGRALRVSRVVAVGPHEGALRLAIRRLKFGGRASVARPLGRLLAEQVREAEIACDVVVPVPIEPARERTRGFNQAEEVARRLAAHLERPLAPDALVRRPRTGPAQVELGLLDRAAAVAGAFTPGPAARAALGGRRVLLVDDVLTTGATLSACADACREAGARTVVGACVARRVGRLRFAARG